MSSSISIVNSGTALKRVGNILIIGLAGALIYCGYNAIDSIFSHLRYTKRIDTIEQLLENSRIDETKLGSVSSLLSDYSRENLLEKADLARFEFELFDMTKEAKIRSLDALITDCNHSEARDLLSNIGDEGLLDKDSLKEYEKRICDISIEGMLEQVRNKDGMEKIEQIEKFIKAYPFQEYPELREQKLKEYVLVLCSYFSTYAAEEKVYEELTRFKSSLMENDHGVVNELDLSGFYEKAQDYINIKKINPTIKPELEHGDRVKVVRVLGKLNGKEETEYWYGGRTSQVPLGTEGYIKEFIECGQGYEVALDNNQEWTLTRQEVEILKENNFLPLISHKVDAIKEYMQSIGGKNGTGD